MDKYRMKKNQNELENLFAQVRNVEFEASPYLATRVLARLRENRKVQRQIWFWRILSGSVVAFGCAALVLSSRWLEPMQDASVKVAQAYVIHVDFTAAEVASVDHVEVELPDGVHFYSKAHAKELAELRKLNLPISPALAGRNKLPFVVQSEQTGEHRLMVRMFDGENNLIRERQLTVEFQGAGESVAL